MLEARVSNWIAKRFEIKSSFKLGHQQLFIFPTRFGFLYLLAVLIIFVLGTNYQNNPILILSYFLFFMFIWSLHACFNNMIRCQFDAISIKDGYVGEATTLFIKVTKSAKPFTPMQLSFWQDRQELNFDYGTLQTHTLSVFLPITNRGLQQPAILKIKSEYPFGLVKAWSYLRFDESFWAFPKPVKGDWQFKTAQQNTEHNQQQNETDPNAKQGANSDSHSLVLESQSVDRQFDGIRTFVPGSPMSQVAWKQYAKQAQGDLLLKDFVDEQQTEVALTLSSIKKGSLEYKLSVLTQAVLDLHRQKQPFVLELSGYRGQHAQVQYKGDEASFQQCLRTLGGFGLAKSDLQKSKREFES
ncbi:DUF58 domain-containing protein [Psychrosphaera ytuae]|uniref:DUF58 domain-containing protein n=1 Tax=Psychrosphaera ytuae TaxID=2820710 RepID=A0A975DA04_9GAMM|nr:DUF58 domain-containing protein [Psychrosphaera ytuae]QTH63049.1 DUF58 domain-containing protein [Psychrosphaera ytuae]